LPVVLRFADSTLSVTSVIHALKAEGTKIKALIDRHIEKMIATLKEKASQETESLTKIGQSVLLFLFLLLLMHG
jgi:hypothetical protein